MHRAENTSDLKWINPTELGPGTIVIESYEQTKVETTRQNLTQEGKTNKKAPFEK